MGRLFTKQIVLVIADRGVARLTGVMGLLDGDCMVSRDCLKVSRLHNGFPRMLNGVVRVNSFARLYGASGLHDVARLLGVAGLHGEARPSEDAARLLHGFMSMLDGVARLAGVAKLHSVSRLSEGLIRPPQWFR